MTIVYGTGCEVGQILYINWGCETQTVKVTGVKNDDRGMTLTWAAIDQLTRRERRGKDKPAEKYYLKYYAKRKAI